MPRKTRFEVACTAGGGPVAEFLPSFIPSSLCCTHAIYLGHISSWTSSHHLLPQPLPPSQSQTTFRFLLPASRPFPTTCRTACSVEPPPPPSRSDRFCSFAAMAVMTTMTSTGSPADRRASTSKSFSHDENVKSSSVPQSPQVSCCPAPNPSDLLFAGEEARNFCVTAPHTSIPFHHRPSHATLIYKSSCGPESKNHPR